MSKNFVDVVFLVACDRGNDTCLNLVEANRITDWTNKQIYSQASRPVQIFGKDGTMRAGVTPHFVIRHY